MTLITLTVEVEDTMVVRRHARRVRPVGSNTRDWDLIRLGSSDPVVTDVTALINDIPGLRVEQVQDIEP